MTAPQDKRKRTIFQMFAQKPEGEDATSPQPEESAEPEHAPKRPRTKGTADDASDGDGNVAPAGDKADGIGSPETPIPAQLRIASWNVASIKAAMKKGFEKYIESDLPDILCLQETKLQAPLHSIVDTFTYKHRFFSNSTARKGYSGVAILSKYKPLRVITDIESEIATATSAASAAAGADQADTNDVTDRKDIAEMLLEGRVLALEFPTATVVTVYTPNAGEGLRRLALRESWDRRFCAFIKALGTKKNANGELVKHPVVLCGDLNVAHMPIDLARPDDNAKTAGFTAEERAGFSTLLEELDMVDVWRHRHGAEAVAYTYYSYRFQAHIKNIGWRIDYFVIPRENTDAVRGCEVRGEFYGTSDHIPVILDVESSLFFGKSGQSQKNE